MPSTSATANLEPLVGPAVTQAALDEFGEDLGVTMGDAEGNVPLDALMEAQWIYESDYYRSLLDKANLTNPTDLLSEGEQITVQYACINRATLQCRIVPAYFVDNVYERTNGQLEIEITSFPELGLAGFDTMTLLSDGTLSAAEIYGGLCRRRISHSRRAVPVGVVAQPPDSLRSAGQTSSLTLRG